MPINTTKILESSFIVIPPNDRHYYSTCYGFLDFMHLNGNNYGAARLKSALFNIEE